MEGNRNNRTRLSLENITRYRNEIYGISALWIMLFHGCIMKKVHLANISKTMLTILNFGNVGVDIFLFLSGISCFFSFHKLQDWDYFLKKRLMRILPSYLMVGVGIWLLIDICGGKGVEQFFLDLSLYSFWKDGEQLFWFIALIILLYMIYPLIYVWLYHDGHINQLNFFLCMITVFVLNAYLKNYSEAFYKNVEIALCRIPVFIIGCTVAYHIYYNKEICRTIYYICFLVGVLSPYICKMGGFPGMGRRYTYIIIGIALTVCFSEMLSAIRFRLLHQFLSFLGEMSLGLYIVHIALRRLFMKSQYYVENCFKEYCVMLIISIIVARIVFLLSIQVRKNKRIIQL